ncbi:MAG TPA: PHP domain-containing protein [Clostridia bacterium]|nr:PHP domain-containing protein [Clostridia bacterium]
MIDGHIHLERGLYTLAWIDRFVDAAVRNQIDEIWLLEHCYRFREFMPMYASVCAHSDYIDKWFHRKAGVLDLKEYLAFIETVRGNLYPVRIKFGVEVCYFKEFENFVATIVRGKGLDFIVGSVHFVDAFAFDHKAEHWNGMDVDNIYRRFFETSFSLAKCGIYDGIAHPDSIKLFGHRPSFPLDACYDLLAKYLAESGMYAEQSSGVYRRCFNDVELGMNASLLRSMKAHGVRMITVSDAHCPEDVGAYIPELCKLIEQKDAP